MKKKLTPYLLVCLAIVMVLAACGAPATPAPAAPLAPPAADEAVDEIAVEPNETPQEIIGTLTLATTTSTEDSGLLDFILPNFTETTGWDIMVISVGTGAALQLGRDGEADVLLVHARAEEDRFVEEGYALARHDVMFNDFVVVGPAEGPIAHNDSVEYTFEAILNQGLPFVSRGDNSGTHIMELNVWENLGLTPQDNPEYIEVGQGMGATLSMTVEMKAFTLADRATWLASPNIGDLAIICEGDSFLRNPYGILDVVTSENPEGVQAFIDWMTSPATQELIGIFGVAEFGQPLFFPEA